MQDEQNIMNEEHTEPTVATEETVAHAEPVVAEHNEEPAAVPAAPTEKVPHRKIRIGIVVSNKMQKSIVVAVQRRVRHPLYKKYFNKTKKFMAHDENNECSIGDTVRIIETRPMSAHKRWRLDAVLEKVK